MKLAGIWALPFVLILLSFVGRAASGSSTSWHVPEAALKFTIEADPNQPPIPSVNLSGQKMEQVSWSGAYYRIDGTLYKDALAVIGPGKAVCACKSDYRRFVALVGVREDADEAAALVFEVFAGDRRLYSSPPLTKYSTPVGIDVPIPAKTKEIRLVNSGNSQGHHWAVWANVGFQIRNESPRVAHVTLPIPGFDPSKYEVVVFTDNGARVPGTRLGTPQEGKIDYLFFGGHGWSMYYAYLVPKDKYTPEPKEWLPDAGLVLETRRVDKSRQDACGDWPGLVKVWNEAGQAAGRSFVAGIHHGAPVHPCLLEGDPKRDEAAKNSLALYRYTGFFEVDRAGEYVFATASNWGSHLLVDDKLVVSWPGRHDYREGITGQKQGKMALQPGVHKMDYFNYSPWGTMFTLAAWQPPGGKLSVMTGSDFPSLRGFVVTGVESNPAAEPKVSFDWNVVDDWRLDQRRVALIRMRFQAFSERAAKDSPDYRWLFDDGVTRTGRTVERVFFTAGKRMVKVQMVRSGQVLTETTQAVNSGALADKMWAEPRRPQAFRQEIARLDFRQAPIRDVVSLYTLGNEMPEPPWKNTAVAVLLERVAELMPQPAYQPLCLELGQYLSSAAVQQYDRANGLYTSLLEKTRAGTPIRQQTMVLMGELLLRCLGQPEAALKLLNQARWEKAPDQTWTVRLGQARVEALLALGDRKELDLQMRQLHELQGQQDPRRQDIRHAGLLAQAALLAREPQDPVRWDEAMANLETILREEPDQVLAPGLNLVRLEVHLARREHRVACYLAQRLEKMDMTVHDRAQVLVRHIKAVCAMGEPDAAKKILAELIQIYPNSEPASQARALIVEAATKARTR